MSNTEQKEINALLRIIITYNSKKCDYCYILSNALYAKLSNLDSFFEISSNEDKNQFKGELEGKKGDFILKRISINDFTNSRILIDTEYLINGYLAVFSSEDNFDIDSAKSFILEKLKQALLVDIPNLYRTHHKEVDIFSHKHGDGLPISTETIIPPSQCEFSTVIRTKIPNAEYRFISAQPPNFDLLTLHSYITIANQASELLNLLIAVTKDNKLFLGKSVPVKIINPDYQNWDEHERYFRVFMGVISNGSPRYLPSYECVSKIFSDEGQIVQLVRECMKTYEKNILRIQSTHSKLQHPIQQIFLELESPHSSTSYDLEHFTHNDMKVYNQKDNNLKEIWNHEVNIYNTFPNRHSIPKMSLCLGLKWEAINNKRFIPFHTFESVGCVDYENSSQQMLNTFPHY